MPRGRRGRDRARSATRRAPRSTCPPIPERLLDLGALRAKGVRAATYEEARKAVEQAALELGAARDVELLQELLDLFAAEYQAGKERESALDFEDLQLLARDLLAGDERVREAEQLRFRSIMVDEFQDTNALQCELIDLLAARARTKEVFYVGDEFQSIYGFRHADVEVFRERRAAAAQRLPLTRELPLAARGARGGQPPLRRRRSATASSRSRRRASSPTRCSAIRSSCS